MSTEARSLLSTDFAHRYTLPEDLVPGLAGLKNAYRGTKHTDAVEALSERFARDLFRSAFASLKPLSGHLAGFMLLQACCKRGDRILVVSSAHGGYDGYMPGYVPDYLGLTVEFLPFDERTWNVDAKAAADAERDFDRKFIEHRPPDEMPTVEWTPDGAAVHLPALLATAFSISTSEAPKRP